MAALPVTETAIPLILPLADAAREMGVDEDSLRDMVQSGKVRAFVDPDGAMYVQMTTSPPTVPVEHEDDINARLSRIRREDFAHLEGVPITVSEAAKKYNILVQTIHVWIKQNLVRVLDPGRGRGSRKMVDESDVAYLATIHHTRKEFGVRSGVPLLAPDGTPNLLKSSPQR